MGWGARVNKSADKALLDRKAIEKRLTELREQLQQAMKSQLAIGGAIQVLEELLKPPSPAADVK